MEYIKAKTIVSGYKNNPEWFGTSYNMNIYKGCCHGCIYCDSRSSCYGIDDFDTVKAKENALEVIRNDLRRKVKTGVVATGAMSDPYNPFEAQLQLTRHALQLIDAYNFGVAIATKSSLITRDIDILKDIKEHSPVLCKITITSSDDATSAKIEPHAPRTSQRFATIEKLSAQGLYTGVLMMPILPFITDTEENIRTIVKTAHTCGAKFIYAYMGLTLRLNQREYFFNRLDEQYPNLKQKYISRYGNQYNCCAPNENKLWGIFKEECEKYGILYKMQDIIRGYKLGYESNQLSFFD